MPSSAPDTPQELKIVASTLGEARFYVGHGFVDVLYGVPIVFSKLDECAALQRKASLFSVMTDSQLAFAQLEAYAQVR